MHYGTWETPITAEKIAEGANKTLDVRVEGKTIYWCETRPKNQGKYTIVKLDDKGVKKDLTPADFNARTFVHEYGGSPFAVGNGVVYTSGADHAIYIVKEGEKPKRLTDGTVRFADLIYTPYGIVAVGEKHGSGSVLENFLALIDLQTGAWKKLHSGYDFYSSPAISSDGKKLSWIVWNNPEMPWTVNELWLADFDGDLKNAKKVCGNGEEAIFCPQWSPDNTLYFVTDRESGWWNLHRLSNGRIENICPMEAEVGKPLWVFGESTYAFLGKDKIVFTYNSEGIWSLAELDLKTKKWTDLEQPGNMIKELRSGKDCVIFLASGSKFSTSIIEIDLSGKMRLRQSSPLAFEEKYISETKHIAYPSNGRMAYGYYYAPQNGDIKAPAGEKPPLVVTIHGGPTAQASPSLKWETQFWTSRGFAVLDVNYGGSTGYGRPYRLSLDHNWGIIDVEDCENGALYLASQNLVDKNKLVIRGGSAGGYTTLAALAFRKTFKAGADYYGVADLTLLANDTHKFEAKYLDSLIGKYPEEKELWISRSPLFSADKITAPLIIFQGADDKIVPKNQAEMIYEALKSRGVPVEMHIYPGEEHGFRRAENIIHSLNREVAFYLEAFNRG